MKHKYSVETMQGTVYVSLDGSIFLDDGIPRNIFTGEPITEKESKKYPIRHRIGDLASEDIVQIEAAIQREVNAIIKRDIEKLI